jgi:hypothetical protein
VYNVGFRVVIEADRVVQVASEGNQKP